MLFIINNHSSVCDGNVEHIPRNPSWCRVKGCELYKCDECNFEHIGDLL